jgi:hypothetical protein
MGVKRGNLFRRKKIVKMFENKMLGTIFGSTREKITGRSEKITL